MEVGDYMGVWGDRGVWCSKESREGYEVGLWTTIKSEWDEFNSKIGFRVGNGRRVKF